MSLQVVDLKEKEREIKLPRLGLLKEKYSFRARKLNLIVMMNVMKMVHLVSFSKSFDTFMRNCLWERSDVFFNFCMSDILGL